MPSHTKYKQLYMDLMRDVRKQREVHSHFNSPADVQITKVLSLILNQAVEREDEERERIRRSYL